MRSRLLMLTAAALLAGSAVASAQTTVVPAPAPAPEGPRAVPPPPENPVGPTTGQAQDPAINPPRGPLGDNPPGSREQDRRQNEDSGAPPEGRR